MSRKHWPLSHGVQVPRPYPVCKRFVGIFPHAIPVSIHPSPLLLEGGISTPLAAPYLTLFVTNHFASMERQVSGHGFSRAKKHRTKTPSLCRRPSRSAAERQNKPPYQRSSA